MIDVNLTGVFHTAKAAIPHDPCGWERWIDRPDQLRPRHPGDAEHGRTTSLPRQVSSA